MSQNGWLPIPLCHCPLEALPSSHSHFPLLPTAFPPAYPAVSCLHLLNYPHSIRPQKTKTKALSPTIINYHPRHWYQINLQVLFNLCCLKTTICLQNQKPVKYPSSSQVCPQASSIYLSNLSFSWGFAQTTNPAKQVHSLALRQTLRTPFSWASRSEVHLPLFLAKY